MDRCAKKLVAEPTSALSALSLSAKSDPVTRVGFSLHADKSTKVENDRKKYLTAKYGQHQMALIKKRLSVELWLIEELQMLYPDKEAILDCEIDLDELLDLDDEDRRRFLRHKLADCPQPLPIVLRFVEELLCKAKSL